MLLNYPLKCICGKKPKLIRSGVLNYYSYSCSCGVGTFGTQKEEYALELWNSTIKHGVKEKYAK